MVVVDTCVWSLLLRRRAARLGKSDQKSLAELKGLVFHGAARVLGPVRQEILSGVKSRSAFEQLRESLRSFPDEPIQLGDYEQAAEFFSHCRSAGVQGSPNDFLICAVAHRLDEAILTTDKDFARYAKSLPIRLHGAARS